MVLLLVVVTLPVYLDVSPLKGFVEDMLTDIVEAPVRVDRAELRVSLWPTVRVHGVSVLSSAPVDAAIFARVESADIRLALIPLFRKQLEIIALKATGLAFDVQRSRDGTGNWPVWTTHAYEIVSLESMDLRDLELDLADQQFGLDWHLRLERLQGGATSDEALHLAAQGSLEELPLFLTLSGPTLTDLTAPNSEFPISAVLELSGLRVELDGRISQTPAGRDIELAVGSKAENLSFLTALSDVEAPEFGGFDLESRVSISATGLTVSELAGTLGKTSVRGQLSVRSLDSRPRLEGRIAMGRVDLSAWRQGNTARVFHADSGLPFSFLNRLDSRLEVSLDGLDGLAVEIDELSTTIQLENGLLELAADLRLADIPTTVSLITDARVDIPTITAEIGARDIALDQLCSLLDLDQACEGSIGTFVLEAESQGTTLEEMATGLSGRVRLGTTRLGIADETTEEPTEILFESLAAALSPRQPLRVTARGQLFDEPFLLQAETAPLELLLSADSWPLLAVGRGAGAEFSLEGDFALSGVRKHLDVDFVLSGERIGNLAAWTGISRTANMPYRLGGHLLAQGTVRSLRVDQASLGRTELTAAFDWDAQDETVPLRAKIEAASLDPGALQELFSPVTRLEVQEEFIVLGLPGLPSRVVLRDVELEFSADRIIRDTVDLHGVHAQLTLRAGSLARSPFTFGYGADEFAGEIGLDLRAETPKLALLLSSEAQDLGEILEQEDIARDQRTTAKRLALRVDAEGSTLRSLIRTADVSGSLEEVRWQLSLPEMKRALDVELDRVDISGPADQPILIEASGRIRSEPLEVRLELRPDADFEKESAFPFRLDLDLAQTRIQIAGHMTIPIEDSDVRVDVVVAADRLDTLGPILGYDLPRIGPYRLSGRLTAGDTGYSVTDLDLAIGGSDLAGQIHVYSTHPRLALTAELDSQRLRVRDLFPPRESESNTGPVAIEDSTAQESRVKPDQPSSLVDALDSLDTELTLRFGEIATTDGTIGALDLEAKLQQGSLELLLQGEIPYGETVDFVIHAEPSSHGIDAMMTTRWNRLPYGVFADILDPGIKKGVWSVDLDFTTRGATIDDLLANLSGHFDFTDYPEGFRATILDLWGGGLVQSLLPVFNLGKRSQLNCTVGRFSVSDGIMIPDKLIVDTTRSRVRGKGTIDLKTKKMNLKLKPRPKKASLVNLATPVRVRGPIDDPSVTFTSTGIAVTAFRFSLWIYTVWTDILRRPLPADGHDICIDPSPRQ